MSKTFVETREPPLTRAEAKKIVARLIEEWEVEQLYSERRGMNAAQARKLLNLKLLEEFVDGSKCGLN